MLIFRMFFKIIFYLRKQVLICYINSGNKLFSCGSSVADVMQLINGRFNDRSYCSVWPDDQQGVDLLLTQTNGLPVINRRLKPPAGNDFPCDNLIALVNSDYAANTIGIR